MILIEKLKKILDGDYTDDEILDWFGDDWEVLNYASPELEYIITDYDKFTEFFELQDAYEFYYGVDPNDDYFYYDAVEIFKEGHYFYFLSDKNKQDLNEVIKKYFGEEIPFDSRDEYAWHDFLMEKEGYIKPFMENLEEEYINTYSETMNNNFEYTVNKYKKEMISKLNPLIGFNMEDGFNGLEITFNVQELMIFTALHIPQAKQVQEVMTTRKLVHLFDIMSNSNELRFGAEDHPDNDEIMKNFQEKIIPDLIEELDDHLSEKMEDVAEFEKVIELGKKFNFKPFKNDLQVLKTPSGGNLVYKGYDEETNTHKVGLKKQDETIITTSVTNISTERLVYLLTNYDGGLLNEGKLMSYEILM